MVPQELMGPCQVATEKRIRRRSLDELFPHRDRLREKRLLLGLVVGEETEVVVSQGEVVGVSPHQLVLNGERPLVSLPGLPAVVLAEELGEVTVDGGHLAK